jgi:subtilisin family serine protease
MSGNGITPPPPQVENLNLSLNVLGVTESKTSGTLTVGNPYRLPLTFTMTDRPREGEAMIGSDGVVTYSIPGHLRVPELTSDSFRVTVSNGYGERTAVVSVQLRTDPLVKNQWHLANTGQDTFSSRQPTPDIDMRVTAAWVRGVSGKGVKVAVVDDGVESDHEDLQANFDTSNSYDFLIRAKGPPRHVGGDSHGTKVAGIIGATAFNGKGGRGVAYGATLRGYNLLAPGMATFFNLAAAMGGDPISSDIF